MTDQTPRTEAGRPDPQSFIPGYRVRYIEFDTVCQWLVDNGWAGGIPFDAAVKAMARTEALDVEVLKMAHKSLFIETGRGIFPGYIDALVERYRAILAGETE